MRSSVDNPDRGGINLHLRLIRVIGVIVPRRVRADWRQEWVAELECREQLLDQWDRLNLRAKCDLAWRSLGAFRDALWMQSYRLEDDMYQDIRFGLRMLGRKAGFTAIAVLTLALGIGANTAIFSVINAVLFQPMPYAKPHELVLISRTVGGESSFPYPPAAYLELSRNSNVYDGVASLSNKGWPATLTESGEPARLQGYQVSANLFGLLGVQPEHGRSFVDEEDRPGANRVVVISHELWQSRFGGDREIIGRNLTLNGDGYSVVGVMQPGFRFFNKADVWTPLAFDAKEAGEHGASYLVLIGRLKPGISIEQAVADTEALRAAAIKRPAPNESVRIDIPQTLLTKEVRPMLWLLFGAVGFVLLIACANVANLLLSHANARRRELAVRAALGAGRFRIIRQLLVESAILAIIGGIAGLLLAIWCTKFLASGLPEYLTAANSRVAGIEIDASALGFAFALSLVTSLLFGLAPAIQASRVNLSEALKDGGRVAGFRRNMGSILVVAEVAMAMVLLVGAGLMTLSFWRLTRVETGYDPAGVLTAKIDPSGPKYKGEGVVPAFHRTLLERISSIPGVRYAGMINSLNASNSFTISELSASAPDREMYAQINQVSPDYFKAMGIPLRAGRFFDDRDAKGSTDVVIIDEGLATQYFAGQNPLGKHIVLWKKSLEVIGVVGSARYWAIDGKEPMPHLYFSYQQENWTSMSLRIRVESGDPGDVTAAVRSEVAALDKDLPIHSFKPMEEMVAALVAPQRFTTFLLGGFAALAGLLAAIGIYGVVSYSVTQRTREIGVRMALGARAGNVMRMVLRRGMMMAVTGAAIGLVVSIQLSTYISSLLFRVEPTDTATLITITVLVVLVAFVACLIPAIRATRVDPISTLRVD
jgi:putative ABC transport system permease protein